MRRLITVVGVVLLSGIPALALIGDCDRNGVVSAEEASKCHDINLGVIPPEGCFACDDNGDNRVTTDEVTKAQNNATPGCCVDNIVCNCQGNSPTPTSTPTPTVRAFCAGNCNNDAGVQPNEFDKCNEIAAGTRELSDCPPCDADGDGTVSSEEIACITDHELTGCHNPYRPNGDCPLLTPSPAVTRTPSTPVVPTATPSGGPTHSPSGLPCVGDCDNDHKVVVNELVTGVKIALDTAPISQCASFDDSHNLHVEVNELVTAVNNLLHNCP